MDKSTAYPAHELQKLTRFNFLMALFNLFLVSLIGVLLRSIPVTNLWVPFYKNILHAHSHFAFGGWVMPALLALLIRYYPELSGRISYRHWRNITVLQLLAAYGMLFSFPFQGYGPVSIFFSTTSILASIYLAVIILTARKGLVQNSSLRFLFAGLCYLVLSSAGPFATVPLIISGKAGTPLYFNAIYFFLHFQYNGWFSFLLLGILYKIIDGNTGRRGNRFFIFMNIACLPAYFLSTLWTHPPFIFYWLGGIAALFQIAALFFLLRDISSSGIRKKGWHPMIHWALVIFVIKLVLQLLSAFPAIADMAYQHRNIIIAYLHMVLLGFVTLFILGAMYRENKPFTYGKTAVLMFLIAWISTELFLVLQAGGEVLGIYFRTYNILMLAASSLFPIAFLMFFINAWSTPENRPDGGPYRMD